MENEEVKAEEVIEAVEVQAEVAQEEVSGAEVEAPSEVVEEVA